MINFILFIAATFLFSLILAFLYRYILKPFSFVFLSPLVYGGGCAYLAHHFSQTSSYPWIYIILGGSLALGPEYGPLALRSSEIKAKGKVTLSFLSIAVYAAVLYFMK
jgi:hypothetical protein